MHSKTTGYRKHNSYQNYLSYREGSHDLGHNCHTAGEGLEGLGKQCRDNDKITSRIIDMLLRG